MENKTTLIGKYCRFYRMVKLELTLRELEGSDNIKALSSFEHGKSSNINHLLKYIDACKKHEEKKDIPNVRGKQMEFLDGLLRAIE